MQLGNGDIFDDKYELLETLGSGGIGTVYKARQLDCDRIVALKILHPHIAVDEEFRIRFMREAQALSRLSQVNIVTVYNLGIYNESLPYMAMEYVKGQSLRSTLNGIDRLPVLRAIKIIRDAAKGLAHVHQHGIVHRDLKPENIIVSDSPAPDTVKLIDFGLARVNQDRGTAESEAGSEAAPNKQKITHTGELIGTTTYMSPEQCMGQNVDFRTDIYSLTACLYEIITGKRLYDADTPVGIIYKHVNDPVPTIKQNDVDLFAPEINSVLEKGLAKDPAARFANMDEFASELDSLALTLQSANTAVPSKAIAGLAFIACLLIALAATVLFKPATKSDESGGESINASSDKQFKKLLPRAQLKEALALLRERRLPESLHKADICLRQGNLNHGDMVTLLFARARESSVEDMVYYLCKIKDLYERDADSCPRDRVLRALMDLAVILHGMGLPENCTQILNYLNYDLLKHGMPDSYKGNFQFGKPGSNQLELWNARILAEKGKLEEARAKIRATIADEQGPWPTMLEACLDFGMEDDAKQLIQRCMDGLSCGSMSTVCLKRGRMQLAEACAARMKEIHSSNAEPEYHLTLANILVEKGEKEKAKVELLNYIKHDLTPSKSREWHFLYKRFALTLMLCGGYKEARELLAKVDHDLPPPQIIKTPKKLIDELENGSQIARYETMQLLDRENLSIEDRANLAIALYHRVRPIDEAAFRQLLELRILLNSEANKNKVPAAKGIDCLMLYEQALEHWRFSRDALRTCDEIIAILHSVPQRTSKAPSLECMEKSMICRKILLWQTIGEKTKALEQIEEIDSNLSDTSLPLLDLLKAELALKRLAKSKRIVEVCKDKSERYKMCGNLLSNYEPRLAAKCLQPTTTESTPSEIQQYLTRHAYWCLETSDRKKAMITLETEYNSALQYVRHDRDGIVDEFLRALSIAGMQKQADEVWKRKFFY